MVTRDEELKWAYLLDPCFELTNSAGKPLTDGYLEVYIAGTRNKYYCASDFAGTLHPFQIPLDSLGSNIVLADPDNAYDVYVYNRFGSLVMSRYNVTPADGGAVISNTERINELEELVVSAVTGLQGQIDDINEALDGKKDKQEEYTVTLTPSQTVSAIIQDENGQLQVITQEIDLPDSVPNVNIVSPASTLTVSSVYDPVTNTNTFNIDISDTGTLEYGQYMSTSDITTGAVLTRIKGNLNTTLDGKIKLTGGKSYHITVRGTYSTGNPENTVEPLQYVEYVSNSRIKVDVDNTVTEDQHFELSYDLFKLAADTDYYVSFLPSSGKITELTVEVHSLSNIAVNIEAESPEYTQGWGIIIDNYEVSVDPSILNQYATTEEVTEIVSSVSTVLQNEIDNIPAQVQSDWEQDDDTAPDYIKNKPDLSGFVDMEELVDVVTSVTSNFETELEGKKDVQEPVELEGSTTKTITKIIQDENGVVSAVYSDIDMQNVLEPGQYVSIENDIISVTGLQPEGDYATHTDLIEAVTAVTAMIPEAQVQSDWEQSDDTEPDYIKNKPDLSVYAETSDVIDIVSAVSTVLQTEIDSIPAQVQSDWNEEDTESPAYIQNKPDLDAYATDVELEQAVTAVTALIPDAQVQSDWTETDDTKKSYIQHKPEVKDVYAGPNIILTDTASGLEISAVGTDTETVSGIAKAYADAVSAAVPEAQIQSDWTQSDDTKKDYIKHKPIPKTLVAGDGISITDTVTGVEISAAVTGIDGYVTEEEFIEVVSGVTGTGDYGQFFCLSASGACTMGKVKGTIDVTNDGKIKLKKGKSYHMTVRGTYTQAVPSNTDSAIAFIEYVTNNNIGINVDRTTTSQQYFDLGFDVYNLSNDTDYYVFFTNLAGTISNLFVEVHTILGGGGGNGGGGGGGSEYNQGWGIVITNNTISVNPSVIPDVSNLATKNEVTAAIATATGAQVNPDWNNSNPLSKAYIQNKPEELTLVGGNNVEIDIVGASAIISASVTGGGGGTTYTAGDYIDITNDTISVTGLDNSNIFWATYNVTTHADVLAAYNAGKRIFMIYGSYVAPLSGKDRYDYFTFIYFNNVGGINGPYVHRITLGPNSEWGQYSGSMQGDWNQTDQYSPDYIKNKPDLTQYAKTTDIPEIELNGNDQVTAIDGHELAGGGGTQVQSNWTEDDTSDPSYIQNKPEEQMLIAGNNVEITVDGASAIISAQGGGGGATYSAGQNISIDSQNVIAVTGLAQADWNSSSGASQILNKPTEKNLVAGANVTITEDNDDVIVETTEIASGLQLVAGPGITMAVSGNQLIVSGGVEKTLLYTGSSSDSRKSTFTLSQSGYNFDRLEMTLIDVDNFVIKQVCEMPADGLVNSNGTRGSAFNSITSGTQTWFKAMNWQLNAAGTTLTYWVDEIATSGNSISAINRDQTGNRPIMLRIYGIKD